MRQSFRRLVAVSVLAAWVIGFALVFVWARTVSWTEERAQRDGVFLLHQLLEQVPASSRPAALEELQRHSAVELSLMSLDEVERRVGHEVHPGQRIPHRPRTRSQWYFVAFEDGQGALAAGPVNPTMPAGAFPIGALLAVIGVPLIAALIALRVARELSKIERASEALAVGELSARVDNTRGPSHELAAKFNAMADRIEGLVRSRDELVQAVSHELGSPLARLRFHMELLGSLPASEHESRRDAMTRELDALDELVSELLTYVQSDQLKTEPTTFDPRQGLKDLAELAELEAPEDRAIDVEMSFPDDIEVFADHRLFLRAVENVLRNAVRYAHGRVRLELTKDPEHIRAIVHDDGPGIDEDVRDKVIIPFFRLDKVRARKTGGIGLGLAIVSRIMLRHGGHIEIGDSPLGGAMISTVWPCRR